MNKYQHGHRAEWPRRAVIPLLSGLFLIPLFFAGSWVYANGQLTLAKEKGIYAAIEEGMRSLLLQGAGDMAAEARVEITNVGPSWQDGRQPHAWFASGWIWTERRPDGGPTTPDGHYLGGGSYFLRLHEGWVHVPEGALPEFVGWVMTLYGLEGAGADLAADANGG